MPRTRCIMSDFSGMQREYRRDDGRELECPGPTKTSTARPTRIRKLHPPQTQKAAAKRTATSGATSYPPASRIETTSTPGPAVAATPTSGAESVSTPAIYVDLKRCIGCNSCCLACRQDSDVQIGKLWNPVFRIERDTYPKQNVRVLSMLCQQCADAPCKNKCDTLGFGAITQSSDGTFYVDPAHCTGCGRCIPACRYHAMFLNSHKTIKLGAPGVAEKCHTCMHRIDAGLPPACVITCLAVTREYGDYDTLKARHPGARSMGNDLKILYENLGAEPKLSTDGAANGCRKAAPFHD